MNLVSDLMALEGVVAAGDFTYQDNQSHHQGDLSDEERRLLAALCRANTAAVDMEEDLVNLFARPPVPSGKPPVEAAAASGWVVHGDKRSLCVMGNAYCVIENGDASLKSVLSLMRGWQVGPTRAAS
ncbi:DUF2173 family protein [Guyparkeria hydrothermalis]|uniref:DUF2173 family protein n=1 Tax=Guyparkeria hydrothermalis TaxID=923 RepID=UPI0020213328|nr:DUF2173 family protein [Guyparkeria hydrothermalis]MCL7744128.1 DUF2173 family protein [Guyparkeria hydrothermalis]